MVNLKDSATTVLYVDGTVTRIHASLDLEEQASLPSTPSSDIGRFVAKTDKKVYYLNDLSEQYILNPDYSYAHVIKTAIQTISTGSATKISWNENLFNSAAFFSSANLTRLTLPSTAVYHIWGVLRFSTWDEATARNVRLRILVNNSSVDTLLDQDIVNYGGNNSHDLRLPFETYLSLTAADYVEIEVLQATGSNRDISPYTTISSSNNSLESYCIIEQTTRTASNFIKEPLGHDISKLPSVISHWRCLSSILDGTTVTDVNAAHTGTAAVTLRAAGRPWYNSEGQIWVTRKVTLANSASLITEGRDASCYVMFWLYYTKTIATNAIKLFAITGGVSGLNTLNPIFEIQINTADSLLSFWESGTNVAQSRTLVTRLAPGMRHICVAREHSGTSTVHAWVDGRFCGSQSGITNPATGTSDVGYFLVDSALADTIVGAAITDVVWGSGAIPTNAQVLEQYNRGKGIY